MDAAITRRLAADLAKASPTVRCLNCGRVSKRRHPSQKFCGKVRGRHLCKDAYWNRERAYQQEDRDPRDRWPESWDEHKDEWGKP